MGVWIETRLLRKYAPRQGSHPVWVCGLKLDDFHRFRFNLGHTLYGCVD